MIEQLDLFNCNDFKVAYKITKPIRLIELFAGIGSQAKALKNLGANFEHYRVIEWDKYAITSYNAVHGTSFETNDITKIHASDLGIVDTDKYEYIMTYSFPCQDLSIAGKQQGMGKGSGTRSGLLWEVERLLLECDELPQVLLMENVPQVHGKKNIDHFKQWIDALNKLGYSSFWKDLNSRDFGIPQNRNRTFMVSIKGDYTYEFPQPFELKLRLKDVLETEVDEKYYLINAQIEKVQIKSKDALIYDKSMLGFENNAREYNDIMPTVTSREFKEPRLVNQTKLILEGNLKGGKWDKINESCRRVYNADGLAPTLHTCQGGNTEPKVSIKNEIKKDA